MKGSSSYAVCTPDRRRMTDLAQHRLTQQKERRGISSSRPARGAHR